MDMDGLDFDYLKAEKANAMRRYRRVNIAKLFRYGELCLVLVFLSWTFARLPFAIRISGEYFRRLIAVIVSPAFIFVLGNVIVITLMAKFSRIPAKTPIVDHSETDLYEEFMRNSENHANFRSEDFSPVTEPEDIVYEDKEIVCEVNTVNNQNINGVLESKAYRRSESEKVKRESLEESCRKLRRSETEKRGKIESSGEIPAETVEKLSNEEFQRTIEAFIARQARFHQEEKVAIVLHNNS